MTYFIARNEENEEFAVSYLQLPNRHKDLSSRIDYQLGEHQASFSMTEGHGSRIVGNYAADFVLAHFSEDLFDENFDFDRQTVELADDVNAQLYAMLREQSFDSQGCCSLTSMQIKDGRLSWLGVGACQSYLYRNEQLYVITAGCRDENDQPSYFGQEELNCLEKNDGWLLVKQHDRIIFLTSEAARLLDQNAILEIITQPGTNRSRLVKLMQKAVSDQEEVNDFSLAIMEIR